MGIKENRKRAKYLKEAKRKREQDALASSGSGPAGIQLQKRADKRGDLLLANTGKVKYSELLKEFVNPIIQEDDDIHVIKVKYFFGAHAWNSAFLKKLDIKKYQQAKNEITDMLPGMPEVELLFDAMVQRKQEEFSEYNNIIVDFEIKKIKGLEYDLSIATMPFNK